MVSSSCDPGFDADLADLNQALCSVRALVRRVRPGRLTGEQALLAAGVLGDLERTAASGIAMLSPRVMETGSFAKCGHASATDWLASLAGSSTTAAKGRLAAGEAAARIPELGHAVREGVLSTSQLNVVATTAAADLSSVGILLHLVAEEAGHQELSAAAVRIRACARSKEGERARRERVHANRHFRWHQDPEGGIRGEFSCEETHWARIAPTLEAATQARWKAAGAAGGASFEAHRLDALIDLLSGSGAGTPTATTRRDARPRVLVLIDAEALRRGTTVTGEVCEIEGIGPVPVEAAVELLGQGALQFLIREGRDIATVTRSSRDLAQKTAAALLARDRICVVPGCGKRLGLEGDHCMVDYSLDGPTTLSNLARLCAAHHDMKTHGGWSLRGEPGNWKWVPPARPPSAGVIARTRRLAAARAKAQTEVNGAIKPLRNPVQRA